MSAGIATVGRQGRLCIEIDGRFLLLEQREIRWIEALGKQVRVHSDRGAFMQTDSLRRLATVLDPGRFLRISRGAIVNLDRVREIGLWFGGDYELLLTGGERLRSTRAFRTPLHRLLRRHPSPPASGEVDDEGDAPALRRA